MIDSWQQFLASQGAVFTESQVVHFGDPVAELKLTGNDAILADLSHWGLIEFAGEDAQTFLQGQFTNDVRQLHAGNSQLSAYCTPKGRVLANFLLWLDAPNAYLMQLPSELQTAIQKRLAMYVLRSKVKVSDAGARYVRLGVAGAGAATALQNIWPDLPQAPFEVKTFAAGRLIRLSGDMFELLLEPTQAPALWDRLKVHAIPAGAPVWARHLIGAGLPVISAPTQEQFVPQMMNYELIGGVNFKKGCYPGQEIVARTQYLGKLKRRMYRARIDTMAAAGDELFSADMPDQATGMIVNAAPSEGGCDALAVIQMSSAQEQVLHLKSIDGPALRLEPLPYTVSE